MPTRTDKVPEHFGDRRVGEHRSERRGGAGRVHQLQARLTPVAAGMLQCDAAAVRFSDGRCTRRAPQRRPSVRAGVRSGVPAARRRCSRKATTGRRKFTTMRQRCAGRPFHYFVYGAAVSEVEVDGFTGDYAAAARGHSGRRGRLAFRRWSIAARSKADSCRASAG